MTSTLVKKTLRGQYNTARQALRNYQPKRKTTTGLTLQGGFKEYKQMLGYTKHPATNKPTPPFDYQIEYRNEWKNKHKVILNKSRKIGATETGLGVIGESVLDDTYAERRAMIVAGNKQSVANRFIERFLAQFPEKFTDYAGKEWRYNDIIMDESSSWVDFYNGAHVQAYPANESVRGEENVKCVFMSEVAFINLLDDTKVYNALHPNVANIPDADFILESTPNGKRGFFWQLAEKVNGPNEYSVLTQPYQVSLGKLITQEFIDSERNNPTIDFEQEYCCKFTTSLTSVFKEGDVKYEPKTINTYDDL